MSDYYQNLVTVTVKDFEATGNANRGGVLGSIGWDSNLLATVRSTLAAYWRAPGRATQAELKRVVLCWKAEKPSEFSKRDAIGNGVCTRLVDDLGTPERNRGMQSVILRAEKNLAATDLTVGYAQQEELNVVSLMTHAHASGQGVGVIVIDLYGTDFRAQGLDRRYDGGNTVLDNMIDVLRFACNPGFGSRQIPVFNFAMGSGTTIGEIARELPDWTVTIKKPTHNSFDGTVLDEEMQKTACKYWVIFGFNANQCVAATIFGSKSTTVLKSETTVMDGLGRPQKRYEMAWCPGALDRGYSVITSRLILASQSGTELSQKEGWPPLGSSNW